MIASSEGGMDIEEVAHATPEKIINDLRRPADRPGRRAGARSSPTASACPKESQAQAVDVFKKLYTCYMDTDASLVEINPLNRDSKGNLIKALDAKFNFDANALFRHPEIVAYRDLDEEDPAEVEASKFDLAYISLDGNIGCLVNGAGLAMATMDTIKLFGGEPANFLDVGGGATAEKVTEAFKIMLKNPNVEGHPRQHLRRHHEVRHHRRGRDRRLQGREPAGAAGRAHEGHERGARARRCWPNRACRSSAPTRWPKPPQKVVAAVANSPVKESSHVDLHQQRHQGHHPGHHRQDRSVPHADVPGLRQRQELLRRRREPEEGRRGVRRTSRSSRSVKEAGDADRRHRVA